MFILQYTHLQIPLHTESSEPTVIITPLELYGYNFIPFGLHVSPAIIQHVINKIIK